MGFGSSWKLSGGRKFSAVETKVSKKRHVRREVKRRALESPEDSGSRSGSRGGRLIQRATAGAQTHKRANGIATGNDECLPNATTAIAAIASSTLAIMRLNMPKIFRSTAYLACAAVTHSNKFLRVTNNRPSVRKIASDISHAWYARRVTVKPIWYAPSKRSDSA